MTPLIVGNWKMNLSFGEAMLLAQRYSSLAQKYKATNIVILAPAAYLHPIFDELRVRPNNLFLGIQNFMSEIEGPYTGENSLTQVKRVCRFALAGHSERREKFGETDESVNDKIKLALKEGFEVIVCVGEKNRYHLEDYYQSEAKKMRENGAILDQTKKALQGVSKSDLDHIHIAYEPIWAIGTENAASGPYAAAVCYIIKQYLVELYQDAGNTVGVLYGGSTDSKNTREFLMQPSVSGLLVGSSSLKAGEFSKICEICAEVKSGRIV